MVTQPDVPAENAGICGLTQVSVRVRDLQRAFAFYRDTLQLQPLFEVPGMAFLMTGSVRLMLHLPELPEFDHPPSILYFNVPDIEASHRVLGARGVRFRGTPHAIHRTPEGELWLAEFLDSEDNTMALMSWKRAA